MWSYLFPLVIIGWAYKVTKIVAEGKVSAPAGYGVGRWGWPIRSAITEENQYSQLLR